MSHDLAHELVKKIPNNKQNECFGDDGVINKKAGKELGAITSAGNFEELEKVWHKYSYTPNGKVAALLFVSRLVDTGQFDRAYLFLTSEIDKPYLFDYKPLAPEPHVLAADLFSQFGDKENLQRVFDKLLKVDPQSTIEVAGRKFDVAAFAKKLNEHIVSNEDLLKYIKAFKEDAEIRRKNIGARNSEFANSPVLPAIDLNVQAKVVSTTMLPDEKTFLALTEDSLKVFRFENGKAVETDKISFPMSGEPCPKLVVLKDGKTIIATLGNNELHLLKLEEGKLKKIHSCVIPSINSITLIPREKTEKETIIVNFLSNWIRVYQIEGDKLLEGNSLIFQGYPWKPAVLPDGKTLLTVNVDGAVYLLKLEDKNLKKIGESDKLNLVGFPTLFPDGKTFTLTSYSHKTKSRADGSLYYVNINKIHIFRVENDKIKEIANQGIGNFYQHNSIDISTDGQLIAVPFFSNSQLSVFELDGNELKEIATLKIPYTKEFGMTCAYTPTILSDNKTIALPTTNGYLLTYKIEGKGLKEVGRTPFQELQHISPNYMLTTSIKSKSTNKKDILIIRDKVFYYFNLLKP